MRILLIGRTGQLGGDLLRDCRGHEVLAPTREELDIEQIDSVVRFTELFAPDVIINTAAFHNVPRCEVEPERAFRINCVAVRNLAALCADRSIRLVTFSSDYVFSGAQRTPYREDDLAQPLQFYGMTRLAGEHAAMAPGHALVIRTCGLYGASGAASKGGNFVDKVVALARSEKSFEMSEDQTACPTSTRDLSGAIWSLIESDAPNGVYHLANGTGCTWTEFSREIVRLAGIDSTVIPVDRGGRSGVMRRPLYSVLDCSKAARLGIQLRNWRDGLADYIREKYPR